MHSVPGLFYYYRLIICAKYLAYNFSLTDGKKLIKFQSKHKFVKAFPPKIVASIFFLIKMTTNVAMS